MREVTDPLADEVVAAVVDSDGLGALNETMKLLVNNRDVIPDALPKVVQDYFEKTQKLPEWADPQKTLLGEKVFNDHGLEMLAMLFFVSLPYSYATKKGSHVLAITAQLTKHAHRRIFRTAQFIVDVMQAGGLGPNGKGIRSVQKVRLIHASIRYRIAHNPKWKSEWDPAWGQPINQEDMVGTIMDFFFGVMKGFERCRIRLTDEEAEAYLHSWKVVGHIIGIRPELIPESVEDAFDLANKIIERQQGESDSGKALIKDLIEFVQRFLPRPLRGLPVTAVRYLAGDRIADLTKSGPLNWTLILLHIQIAVFRTLEKFQRSHPGAQKYIRFLTWNLVDRVVLFEEGGEFYFDIPDNLRSFWRLSPRGSKASFK
jgi:hypothetical protein